MTDSEGGAIGRAHILIRADPSGQKYLYIETNASGEFKAQVDPGFYDLCIMANAFAPKRSKVLIKQAQTAESTLVSKLVT